MNLKYLIVPANKEVLKNNGERQFVGLLILLAFLALYKTTNLILPLETSSNFWPSSQC